MGECPIFTGGTSLRGLKNESTEIQEMKAAEKVKRKPRQGENQRQEAPDFVYKFCPNLRLTPKPHIGGTDVKQLH